MPQENLRGKPSIFFWLGYSEVALYISQSYISKKEVGKKFLITNYKSTAINALMLLITDLIGLLIALKKVYRITNNFYEPLLNLSIIYKNMIKIK